METKIEKMTVRGIAELLMNGLGPSEIVETVNSGVKKPINLLGIMFDCDVEHNITGMTQQFGVSVRITTTYCDGLTKFELNANSCTTVTRYFRDLTIAEYELLCRLAQYIDDELTREF